MITTIRAGFASASPEGGRLGDVDLRALGDASAFIAYVASPAKRRAGTCVTNALDATTFSRLASAVCERENVDIVSVFSEPQTTALGKIAREVAWPTEFVVCEMRLDL